MSHPVSFFILFISFASSVAAQENEVTLESVVVTATRDAEEIRKVPANVTVITQEGIAQSNAQNVVDLLKDQVDVVVRDDYGNGKTAAVDIRGFGETGTLNVLAGWTEDGSMTSISAEWTGPRFPGTRSNGLKSCGAPEPSSTGTMPSAE